MDENFTPITTPGTGTIDGHASATIGTGTEAGIRIHNDHEDYLDLEGNVIYCPEWFNEDVSSASIVPGTEDTTATNESVVDTVLE